MILGIDIELGEGLLSDSPKAFLYCKWLSDATLYAIRNGIEFHLLETAPDDFDGYTADMDNTSFYTSSDITAVNGNVPMTLRYQIPETEFSQLSDRSIRITFSPSLELAANSVTLNGDFLTNMEYSEDHELSFQITEASGTVQFYAKPMEAGYMAALAELCYRKNGEDSREKIGIIYLDVPLLQISAPNQTAQTAITVTGVTMPGEDVVLSVNGTEAAAVKAKMDGTFRTVVELPAPVSGTVYTVNARLLSDSSVTADASVSYSSGTPTMTKFDMYYYAHTLMHLDLLHTDGAKLTNSIYPGHPFKFVVQFENYEALGKVYVASTKNGITSRMRAWPTDTPGEYIAEGYFEGTQSSYVPGIINVYYTTTLDQEEVTSAPSMEDLPDFWKDAEVDVISDEEDEFSAEIAFDQGGSVVVESAEVTIQSLREELLGETGNGSSAISLRGDEDVEEILVEFIKLISELGKTYGKNMISNGYDVIILHEENDHIFRYIYLDTAKKAIESTVIKYSGAMALYSANELFWCGYMWDKASWSTCLTVSKTLYGEYKALVHTRDDIIALDDARNAIALSSMSDEEKQQALENLDRVQWLALALDAYRIAQPFLGLAIKYSATTAFGPVGAFAVMMLWDVANELILNTAESLIGRYLEYLKAGGQDSFLKWLIDPSGYVYNLESGARLAGVTVTAYWIPYDEEDETFWDTPPTASEYGTLWDASEYSQQNPLLTDVNGCYAWEVPEGWWRVQYEKDGYETTWSDWMTVPPIQTEVNISLQPNGDLPQFTDVPEDAYYAEPVAWAVANGITSGTSSTTFSPTQVCNRAQVVTFLWRAMGSQEPTIENPFTDVEETDWYYKAVLWAAEAEITTGTGNGLFSPKQKCSRAQTVTFLWRAAGSPAPTATSTDFTDVSENAWYRDAVLWAVENGITAGTDSTHFSPNKLCNRAQVVTFLYKALSGE